MYHHDQMHANAVSQRAAWVPLPPPPPPPLLLLLLLLLPQKPAAAKTLPAPRQLPPYGHGSQCRRKGSVKRHTVVPAPTQQLSHATFVHERALVLLLAHGAAPVDMLRLEVLRFARADRRGQLPLPQSISSGTASEKRLQPTDLEHDAPVRTTTPQDVRDLDG